MFLRAARAQSLRPLWRTQTSAATRLSELKPFTRRLTSQCQDGTLPSTELLPRAEKWKSLFVGEDRKVIESLLEKASMDSNCKDAQYRLGSILVAEVNLSDAKQPEVSSTASQVREDIAKIRKQPVSRGGSRADFEKAKKLRGEKNAKNAAITGGKVLVVDSGAETRREVEKRAMLKTDGVKWIELAASQGHAQAQCFLGNELLRKGMDAADLRSAQQKASDVLRAREWYEAASRAGCAEASFNVGVMLHDGVSVDPPTLLPADSEDSTDRVPAASRSSQSRRKAGEEQPSRKDTGGVVFVQEEQSAAVSAVEEDLPRSFAYFQLAAQQGEPAASLWCGYCFSTGEGGAESVDRQKALVHLQTAVADAQTAAKAHFYLAQLHRPPQEHESDNGAAEEAAYLHHMRQAVDLGDEDAQYTLADLHLKAHFIRTGDEVDLSAAEEGFAQDDCRRRVAPPASCGSAGHVHGENCGHHHHQQHRAPEVSAEQPVGHLERAVELLRAASAAGQASATLTLGALVYQGLVQCDPEAGTSPKRSAFELYNLAAEQGSLEAWRNIASMHFLGDGVPKCENTAREIMRVIFAK